MQVSRNERKTRWLKPALLCVLGFGGMFAVFGCGILFPWPGQTTCETNEDCTGDMQACIEGVCTTVECMADADCDDEQFCNGDETCDMDTYECVAGTNPCGDDEECDEENDICQDVCESDADCDDGNVCTDDACVEGVCEYTNNTADCDDGDPCTEDDVCSEGACAGTPIECADDLMCVEGECVECATDEDCADGFECNDEGMCEEVVVPPDEFTVTIDNCPTESLNSGDTYDFEASVELAEGEDVWYVWEVDTGTIAATTNGASTATFTAASGNADVMVTAYDYDDTNTNGMWDSGEEIAESTANCDVSVQFTPELQVDAGGLTAARSAAGGYASGVPGVAGNNALNGSANQQGVAADAIATEWTIDSQPTGSGSITFSNASQLATSFAIGAPASAGDYVFRLTATNENTGETAFDTVTLQLLDNPQLRLDGDEVARRFVQHGNSIDITVEYQCTAATTYNIYAKEGIASNAGAQVLLDTAELAASPGAWTQATITVDTATLTEGAVTLDLGWEAIDVVGVTNTGGVTTQLAKSAGDESIANRRNACVHVGAARTNTQVDAVATSAATAANPAEPAGLDVDDQVGMPVGLGTANAIDAFNSTNVIYPGIGARPGDVGTLNHTAGTMLFGMDVNNDGLDDIVFASGNNIEVIFGSVATLTNGQAFIGDAAAAGTAADDTAAANQDWQDAGAFVVNVRTRIDVDALVDADIESISAADYNNDGNLDFAYIGDDANAGAVCGFVFLPGNTTGDPDTNAVITHRWIANSQIATDGLPSVDSGDFNGDGVMDAVFGLPEEDPSAAADGAPTNTEGAIYVVYGAAETAGAATLGSGFPTNGRLNATFAADADGFYAFGTAAANTLYGESITLGDVTGSAADDIVFRKGLTNDQEVKVIAGTTGDQADPGAGDFATYTIDDVTNEDFDSAHLAVGNVTGGTKSDIVIGAYLADTTQSASSINEGVVYIIPSSGLASAQVDALSGLLQIRNARVPGDDDDLNLGRGIAIFDYNDDGTDDLIVGHDAGANAETVYIAYGPVSGTGLNFNNTQNGFNLRLEGAFSGIEGFAKADVNGDGVEDILLYGTNWAGCIAGLE